MNNGNTPPPVQVPTAPQIAPEQDIDITLTLKLSMVNTVIASLDELPHKFSRGIIDAIHQQAMSQINRNETPGGSPNGLNGSLADKVIN